MSRISDVLIDIQERMNDNMSDAEIADIIGCPESWVRDARENEDRMQSMPEPDYDGMYCEQFSEPFEYANGCSDPQP